MDTSTDTRIPAWDPMIGYLITAARVWKFTGLVDEGPDAVIEMARAAEARDVEYAFFRAVAAHESLEGRLVAAHKYGDSPGGAGYVEMMVGDESVMFAFDDDESLPTASRGGVWANIGPGGYDDIPVTEVTVDRVAAAMIEMARRAREY